MKKQANSKTDKILNSLDGIKKMRAPDFFYTRLRAKMEVLLPVSRQNTRLIRPAYAIAFLALLIAFNVISLLKQNNVDENTVVNSETENSQTIASAYNMDDNLSYELNQ